jgi:hypothetical protein
MERFRTQYTFQNPLQIHFRLSPSPFRIIGPRVKIATHVRHSPNTGWDDIQNKMLSISYPSFAHEFQNIIFGESVAPADLGGSQFPFPHPPEHGIRGHVEYLRHRFGGQEGDSHSLYSSSFSSYRDSMVTPALARF